jgi:hypothetical protein
VQEPKRIWWARPRKLCALERPGGGGRTHRPDRRDAETEYLRASGVRLVVSVMRSRHNLAAYDAAGLAWHHAPLASPADAPAVLEEVVALLRRELRRRGAVAVHGDLRTGVPAAVCAAHLHEATGADPADALVAAASFGLDAGPDACALLGVDPAAVERRLSAG